MVVVERRERSDEDGNVGDALVVAPSEREQSQQSTRPELRRTAEPIDPTVDAEMPNVLVTTPVEEWGQS
jgi:hypothetical protein